MRTTLHKSELRGLTSTPWLVSRHSFSFNNWHDPERVQFGALRVLNDDLITPGSGFPPHSHRDMEIVTIPLLGSVAHEDSSGGKGIVGAGEVQIMSAGTGVTHSEYNASDKESLELLQLWILPQQLGLLPRYEEKSFLVADRQDKWQVLVSPTEEGESLKIFQNAWFSVADIGAESALVYNMHDLRNGAYVFLLTGALNIAGNHLLKRDALGILDVSAITIDTISASSILVIEVPL